MKNKNKIFLLLAFLAVTTSLQAFPMQEKENLIASEIKNLIEGNLETPSGRQARGAEGESTFQAPSCSNSAVPEESCNSSSSSNNVDSIFVEEEDDDFIRTQHNVENHLRTVN